MKTNNGDRNLVPPKLPQIGKSPSVNIEINAHKTNTGGILPLVKSDINISGPLANNTVVTDRKIQISLPEQSNIRTLNLVYEHLASEFDRKSLRKRVEFLQLLQHQPRDFLTVHPVPEAEIPEVLQFIEAGDFELIATERPHARHGFINKSPSLKHSASEADVQDIADELQLLRIKQTGEFYTYDTKTRHLNLVQDTRLRNRQAFIDAEDPDDLRLLPNLSWTYGLSDTVNFYREYLIHDKIERKYIKRQTFKFNKFPTSLPDRPHLPELQRRLSFTSDDSAFRNAFYRRYLNGDFDTPLNRSKSDRPRRRKLTRSNLLRHELFQKQLSLPRVPLNIDGRDVMDGKTKGFDADDALQEQNLKCPVCKNFYDSRDRQARIAQCLHSMCHSCLRTRVRGEMVQCPVCSEVQEIPNNEIELLPVDHARQHLVKYYKIRNKATEVGCDSCDPRNRATHRCKECDEFLCGVCTEAHKRTKVTKGHNVAAVESLKKASLDEFHHKRTCPIPEHDDQHFSFYCYSKGCDQPICSLCAVTEHNKADGHDIRNINDVYVENKRLVESLMIDVRHKKNTAEEAIQSIEDEIQNLYIKENAMEEELDQAFLACQKQLEKRKNELKEKLTATSKAKKKGMESQLDKLISEKNSLDHAARFANNVLGYSDATEFLQIKDSLFGRLGELKELDIDTRPHNKADIKFHGHKMLDAFQKFSNKMGEVWSTTAFIPNTKIQTYDIGLGREETAMMITLHDYEKRPLAEPGVDIRVEVMNPQGKKVRAQVLDLTDSEGAYKVLFHGTKLGEHRASVFIMGLPVIDPGVTFKVRRQGALEQDIVDDYEPTTNRNQQHAHVASKIDMGLKNTEDDDYDDSKGATNRSKSYRVFGDIICPDFSLDVASCHPQNMVTSDGRTLRNDRGRTAHIGTALKNYRGTIGTRPFSKVGRFYFEVVVYFFIKRQLRNDLIFEVAIARKSEIDKNYTVDGSPYAYTVCARRCPLCRTVCLMTFHNGVRLYHNPLTENSPPGTTLRTTIGFLVDVKSRQWFIVDAKNRRLFFRFKSIDTTKPLWPVFGAYSTEYVSVSLALKTGKDIQAVPDIPSDI